MAINFQRWPGRARIFWIIGAIIVVGAALMLLLPTIPEHQVISNRDDFFQQYDQTVNVLIEKKAFHQVEANNSPVSLSSHVVNEAVQYAIKPIIHSRTAELLELSVVRAAPEKVIQWLAILRVSYRLHISSIRIILSDDKKTVSIPELTLVIANF